MADPIALGVLSLSALLAATPAAPAIPPAAIEVRAAAFLTTVAAIPTPGGGYNPQVVWAMLWPSITPSVPHGWSKD